MSNKKHENSVNEMIILFVLLWNVTGILISQDTERLLDTYKEAKKEKGNAWREVQT